MTRTAVCFIILFLGIVPARSLAATASSDPCERIFNSAARVLFALAQYERRQDEHKPSFAQWSAVRSELKTYGPTVDPTSEQTFSRLYDENGRLLCDYSTRDENIQVYAHFTVDALARGYWPMNRGNVETADLWVGRLMRVNRTDGWLDPRLDSLRQVVRQFWMDLHVDRNAWCASRNPQSGAGWVAECSADDPTQ